MKLSKEKKDLIKRLKKEAQKATSKIMASTFDTEERNKAFLAIQELLNSKIKEVKSL